MGEAFRAVSEVERVGVRYGFVGGGRACFRPAADSSDGVVKQGWGVGVASASAAKSCDGVDERVFMVVINRRYNFVDFEVDLMQ